MSFAVDKTCFWMEFGNVGGMSLKIHRNSPWMISGKSIILNLSLYFVTFWEMRLLFDGGTCTLDFDGF